MIDADEDVVLVNADDTSIGTLSKLEAHRTGRLHRAFSVFIRDGDGRILLQRRANGKYHSGGLWTNACCGHPRPDEQTRAAAERRLEEEMGVRCELIRVSTFTYFADLDNGLVEHELDHVFIGTFSGDPVPDADEVSEWRWIDLQSLLEWIATDRQAFTAWFTYALDVLELQEPVENLR